MATNFFKWQADPFFSTAEDVQDSADRLESTFRKWMKSLEQEREGVDSSPKGSPRLDIETTRRQLVTACNTVKWQLEAFEREVNKSAQDEFSYSNSGAHERRKQFVDALRSQVSIVEKGLAENSPQEAEDTMQTEISDRILANFLSSSTLHSTMANEVVNEIIRPESRSIGLEIITPEPTSPQTRNDSPSVKELMRRSKVIDEAQLVEGINTGTITFERVRVGSLSEPTTPGPGSEMGADDDRNLSAWDNSTEGSCRGLLLDREVVIDMEESGWNKGGALRPIIRDSSIGRNLAMAVQQKRGLNSVSSRQNGHEDVWLQYLSNFSPWRTGFKRRQSESDQYNRDLEVGIITTDCTNPCSTSGDEDSKEAQCWRGAIRRRFRRGHLAVTQGGYPRLASGLLLILGFVGLNRFF